MKYHSRVPIGHAVSDVFADKQLPKSPHPQSNPYLQGTKTLQGGSNLDGNIENFYGFAQVPVGLAGPLSVNEWMPLSIPLATTEGALVASYSRGMKACSFNGGITSIAVMQSVLRAPFFRFNSVAQTIEFSRWIADNKSSFQSIVQTKSNYAKLEEVDTKIEGNSLILLLSYSTGDAAGQNMVTICSEAICRHILDCCPIVVQYWYIESNYSGDKKASALSFISGRGWYVTAEAFITKATVRDVLKTTPESICTYWQSSTLAMIQSGALGSQGHVSNGLTALFIACGQDVACVAESSAGITRMEQLPSGDLYCSLTLPALMVGTVGGGTSLPTQRECLEMLDCYGFGKAKRFAEVCTAVCLAGEVSIAAAIANHDFTAAHARLGRPITPQI